MSLPAQTNISNEAPRSKLRGIRAEFLRSQPHFAKASLGVPLAPSSSEQALRFSAKGNKNDPRVLSIKTLAKKLTSSSNWSNKINLSNWTNSPERFANLMVTLLSLENYLLDQMLRSLEQKFITEGGYSENLFKKRLENKGY